jgi:hypothetical protein
MIERGDKETAGATGAPRDAGKTSGGGSLGHDQPKDVADQTNIRNQAGTRKDTGRQSDDPVMPSDDQSLPTKI